MLVHAIVLALSFFIILAGSETFTNGVEWAGEKMGVAEAAVGSLLAAVGTALPETFIPLIALVFSNENTQSHSEVGVGAIVGAPLMLSTVALFVMGIATLVYRKRRGRIALRVSRLDARRDLLFFLPIFLALTLLGLGRLSLIVRRGLAAALLAIYGCYGYVMLRISRAMGIELEHGLYLERALGGDQMNPRSFTVTLQVVFGTFLIILGAREFVEQIVAFSVHAHVNPGVLSLILSPLATELPEKYNSVVWIRQRKDHLALANITGAMVFQSCIPVAIGLAFSSWHLTHAELLGAGVALASSVVLYVNLRDAELGTPTLMLGGVAYAIFIAGLIFVGAG